MGEILKLNPLPPKMWGLQKKKKIVKDPNPTPWKKILVVV